MLAVLSRVSVAPRSSATQSEQVLRTAQTQMIVQVHDDDLLDISLREASTYFNSNLPSGNKLVILNIVSDSDVLSDYIIDELIAHVVNDKVFTVVDRQQLATIRTEQLFQLSGEVDDKTATDIGKFVGAQTIVSGSIADIGGRYRLSLRALEVATTQVQGQFNKNIPATTAITAMAGLGKKTVFLLHCIYV